MADIKKYLQPKYLLIGGIAIVGGLIVATKFRPKQQPAEVVATPISQPYAVANTEGYSPSQGLPAAPPAPLPPNPVPTPNVPARPTRPGPQLPPIPIGTRIPLEPTEPRTPVSPKPIPLPGTPRKEPTPPVPTHPPATPNVPGGYPLDCRGVLPRPSDHPGANPATLVAAKGGGVRGRAIVLEWAVMGIASSGHTGLSRFTAWFKNPVYWPLINQNRRNRGLKALTETQFRAAGATLDRMNLITQGRDDRFTDAMLQELWSTYHVPFLC